jgi:hypothetical protein
VPALGVAWVGYTNAFMTIFGAISRGPCCHPALLSSTRPSLSTVIGVHWQVACQYLLSLRIADIKTEWDQA